MKVLIAGGGIGGLSAALSCAHFGHDVIVLEKAQAFGEVGAGIQIPPNAMKVFHALGLADRITRQAVQPRALETRMGRSGRSVFSVPLLGANGADLAMQRWGASYFHIHRADYIAALLDGLTAYPSAELRLGAELADIETHDETVSVTLADGSRLSGDLLIGADGLHSAVRRWMHGPDQPVYTGNAAWRAVVPIDQLGADAPDMTACVWMGPGRHAVTYQLRGGTLANLVGVVETDDAGAEGWQERGTKAAAQADFAGWHPVVQRLIEAAPEGGLFRWALYDRAPLPHWVQGRAALLGDAAHPMLPFLAQGAAMAVEDGWVLAKAISTAGDMETALRTYETMRLARASRTQAGSRGNAKTFHKSTPLSQLAAYGPMWLAGKLAPPLIRQRLDWLYGADVT